MSSNFYTEKLPNAVLGLDIHKYYLLPAVPVPDLYVAPMFLRGSLEEPDQETHTVSADGAKLLKGGATLEYIPHIPVPLQPVNLALELPYAGWLLLDASSKAELSAHSVTSEGGPLAVCIIGGFGLNVQCGDWAPTPTGLVMSLASVQTSPTTGDYVGALAGYASGVLFGKLEDWLGGDDDSLKGKIRKLLLEALLHAIGVDFLTQIVTSPERIHSFIQRAIDEGIDEAWKQWKEDVKKATEAEKDRILDPQKQLDDFLKKLGMRKGKAKT